VAIPPADLPQSSDDDPQDSANRTVADVASTAANPDLALVDEHDWGEARRRLRLIEPLLGVVCPRSIVTAQAKSGGVVATTIYRWAHKYRASGGLLSSLLPVHPSGGRGRSRLEPDVEKVLMQTVEDHYLTKQQFTIRSTAMEVVRRCREACFTG
jgi:putative transposase